MSDSSESGFKTVDRRRFTPEGEARSEGSKEPAESASGLRGETFERHPEEQPSDAPEVSFGTLCLSLHTQALFHLGLIRTEDNEAPTPNFPLARYTIDILHMLREKTQGNLTADEGQLLNGLLYELQVRFVETSRK
ncbi:MAG: DUF1844 domain-containing protein [Deltaproteobacteria bacterium]|nr:DUF1844 domain-containing protein [Deltaproteobacteria bacterium]